MGSNSEVREMVMRAFALFCFYLAYKTARYAWLDQNDTISFFTFLMAALLFSIGMAVLKGCEVSKERKHGA